MRVAGIQADLAWEDPRANFERLAPRIAAAAAAGARLVAVPEMFPTGFSMDAERVSEPPGGPAERFLLECARSTGAAVCGSAATRPDEASGAAAKPRNLGLLAVPDGSVGRYAKIHPFTFGGETERYASGDRALTLLVAGVRVSLLICYDLRFPELFAALAPRTDLFCVVANWPEARRDHWRTLLKARSIEFLAYVLGVNRVGSGGKLKYAGDSVLWAPGGELLAEAAPGAEETIAGEVDPERVSAARKAFPVLSDRRPEVYRAIAGEGEPPNC
ncbi:MAG: carbon-nitrogen family hydrolase [Planctomycetes bacterium]|nr:carbon-nitrogen family hydrolase [Planctomycetota bacterium]